MPPDQIGRHRRQLIVISVLDVLTLDVAGIGQCFAESREIRFAAFGRKAREQSNHGHRLLRARLERPCRRTTD